MRAFVRVLPLFAAAAQLAACGANYAAKGIPGGANYAGAASPIETRAARVLPDRALLSRQPAPPCELKDPPAGIRPEEASVVTIDYERQCYRQLAEIVHTRRAKLQDAVASSRVLGARDQALLQPEPAPHCDTAKPPATPPDARAAALDAERQCFRQIATSEGAKLEALQDAVRKATAAPRGPSGPRPTTPMHQYMMQHYMMY